MTYTLECEECGALFQSASIRNTCGRMCEREFHARGEDRAKHESRVHRSHVGGDKAAGTRRGAA